MELKRGTYAQRTWSILRMELLLKGSALKRRLIINFHILAYHLKNLRCANIPYNRSELYREINNQEHEWSFKETPSPSFRFKLNPSFFFPCFNPKVADKYSNDTNLDDDDVIDASHSKDSCLIRKEVKVTKNVVIATNCSATTHNDTRVVELTSSTVKDTDGSIDTKADEFIQKFYKQMELQRQASLLQYN